MTQERTAMSPGHSGVPCDGGGWFPTGCAGAARTLALIGDKWTVLTIMLLADGPRRFNDLKRSIGVSQRMLTLTLRALERQGLVTRTAFATIPPRVDYALTPLGHSLREPVEALGRWAITHEGVLKAARQRFDATRPPAGKVPAARENTSQAAGS